MSEKEKVEKALDFYNKGEYQKAIDIFSSVLETCQDNAELYNNIALCYANLNDFDRAEKNYLKSTISLALSSALPILASTTFLR